MARILVVGGYGEFGSRAAMRLARDPDLDVIIAGRDPARAASAAARLGATSGRPVASAAIDALSPDLGELRRLAPAAIVNAAGPFQTQEHALVRAAIAAGAHYVDLADATAFVMGLATHAEIDRAARAAGVLVVTGASTVPGLSSAVIEHFAPEFQRMTRVSLGISPGNSFDPGPATVASIFSGLGQPYATKRDGAAVIVHGWQGLIRHRLPRIGERWFGYCDVPDRLLLPQRWPTLATVDVRAGVEVGLFHLGLWALSWPARWGWLGRPERLAAPLLAAKRRLAFLGSDRGGMFLTIEGQGRDGATKRIDWHLIAEQGHGPFVPAIPAVILARHLAHRRLDARGVRACVALISLAEFLDEVADLAITAEARGRPPPATGRSD